MTWVDVTEEMSAKFFVDPTFKCIDGNWLLVDADEATEDNVVPPQHSEILEDDDALCPGLITTDPLFLLLLIMFK